MKLFVVGNKSSRPLSDELAYAWSQMRRSLPPGVAGAHVDAATRDALVGAALVAASDAGLADDDEVLLLRHAFLWWAAGTLERLSEAVGRGAGAALSYDSLRPCPQRTPDYMTIRGIERYVDTLAATPPLPYVLDDALPAMLLTTVGALRDGRWSEAAVLVPGAYAHDFSGYHQGRREDLLPLIPRTAERVLDVGGGEGGFLDLLKSELGCETHLAEYSATACEIARDRVDRVWPGDFLGTEFDCQFDCVSLLDVLEHTTWPAAWLRKAAALLRPEGSLVVSIPNVGHWSVVADLLEGRWDYAAAGIHCITHLRFFTRQGVEQLMGEAGLIISEIRCTRINPPAWFDVSAMASSLRLDSDSLATYSFLIVARPQP